MATKRRKPLIYPDTVRPPRKLPDAESVLKLGMRLDAQELMIIRSAMAIHSASRQPKLTWSGWHQIAIACAIGVEHFKKAAGGRTDTRTYTHAISQFLKGTGFQFINKNDRAAAVRMLPRWDEIDAWRASLSNSRQQALNNPREVWDAFLADRRALGDPEAKPRPPASKRRQFPSWLEQMAALEEQLLLAEERAERAEHEAEYFATMMDEVAKVGKLDDDAVAAIRAKVRAAHGGI